ncbi:E3 SUMO-protein ligase PIAS2 isoform 9-T19 [Syngnathus typhle]
MNLQDSAPQIPPVHPDVQMKSLPFYDVLDILIKPSSLGASTSPRYHQEKYFIFALTPQQVREVCISRDFLPGGRRDYMVQIQLRFCLSETSCPQEDIFPTSLCIKVNGKPFPLPGYAPPPKNGVEQRRPGKPLNITSLVRLSSTVPNQISVTWAPEIGKTFSMSVYLVRQLTSPLLLQRLRMKGIRNPDHSRALTSTRLRQSLVAPHSAYACPTKKADVIDLTLESSSSDDEDKSTDPPLKKHCVYISKNEDMHPKGVLTYQPSNIHMSTIQALDPSYLTSTLADYGIPFHPSTLATIPTELQSLDLFLIQADPQHYRPQMFLENLTSTMQSVTSASTSSALVSSSSSRYERNSHAAGSIHETWDVAGGGSTAGGVIDNSVSDIISLD